MQIEVYKKFRVSMIRVYVLALLLTTFYSCKVQLVPQYSAELEQQILNTAKMNDKLYLEMINAPADKKNFDLYAEEYLTVQVEINSILLKNETRPKAGDIVASIQKLKDYFIKATEDHKTRHVLSNGELMIYNEQLKGFWKPVLIEEMALKKAK